MLLLPPLCLCMRLSEGEWTDMPLNEIIKKAKENDSNSLEYIIEKYRNLVKIKTRTYYILGGDNEDLIQEGMIGLYKAIKDYDENMNTSFDTFAELCIVRQIQSAIKSANRKKHMPLNSAISLNTPLSDNDNTPLDYVSSSQLNPEILIIDKENLDSIYEKIEKTLTPLEYMVLSLYLKGYDYSKIGITMGKNEKSVDNAIQRIRKKVNNLINK